MFSTRSSAVVGVSVKFVIHFKLIFVYGWSVCAPHSYVEMLMSKVIALSAEVLGSD